MQLLIREGTLQDLPFLRQMLFEAAYWRPDVHRPALQEGLSQPEIAKLLADWGREGDTAVIAETVMSQSVGAAWYRYWTDDNHSYGYVSADIPELGIAVCLDWRRRGVGNTLLSALKQQACQQGVESLSLSVEKDNPAHNLYLQHRFRPIEQVGNAWTMVAPTGIGIE